MSTSEFKAIPVRPCAKCGAADRSPSGGCRPCRKATNAAWRAANPEKAKSAVKTWRKENPERQKAINAEYRQRHPDRLKARASAWVKANPERHNANTSAWARANPEQAKVRSAAWDKANPERKKANSAAWEKANPDARRIYAHNRRTRERESGGVLSKGLAAKLFKLQKGKCACCNQPLGEDFNLDHITPLALGGPNIDSNIQLLRQKCNRQKSFKDPIDFMQQKGFLL